METEQEKNMRLNNYAREKVVRRLIENVKQQEIKQKDYSHAPRDLDEEIGHTLNKMRERYGIYRAG